MFSDNWFPPEDNLHRGKDFCLLYSLGCPSICWCLIDVYWRSKREQQRVLQWGTEINASRRNQVGIWHPLVHWDPTILGAEEPCIQTESEVQHTNRYRHRWAGYFWKEWFEGFWGSVECCFQSPGLVQTPLGQVKTGRPREHEHVALDLVGFQERAQVGAWSEHQATALSVLPGPRKES